MKPEHILLSEKFQMRLAAAIVGKAVAGVGKNFTYEEGIRHGADVVLDELIRALKEYDSFQKAKLN